MATRDNDCIMQKTRFVPAKRETLVRYYKSMPESIRLEVHRLQGIIMLKKFPGIPADNLSEDGYSSLLLAVSSIYNLENGLSGKKNISVDEAEKITALRLARAKARKPRRPSPIRDIIETRFYEEIKKLREKLSWREIADYLARNYKTCISHGYLQQVFEQIASSRMTSGKQLPETTEETE